jgi:NO-binding membrane sensor protein with MHYT domain
MRNTTVRSRRWRRISGTTFLAATIRKTPGVVLLTVAICSHHFAAMGASRYMREITIGILRWRRNSYLRDISVGDFCSANEGVPKAS